MTIAVLWFWLYMHVKLEKQATQCLCLTELSSALLCRALNRNWADAEREMCVHALNRNWADRRRERYVCMCWESKTLRSSTGDSRRLNKVWALYFRENVAKGVCNVAKLATLCTSISPPTSWATGQTENMRCVNLALIKLVPLKGICINTLLTR